MSLQTSRSGASIVAFATLLQAVGTAVVGVIATPAIAPVVSFCAFFAAAVFCVGYISLRGDFRALSVRFHNRRFVLLAVAVNAMSAVTFVGFFLSLAYIPATAASVLEAGVCPVVAFLATFRKRAGGFAAGLASSGGILLLAVVIALVELSSSAPNPGSTLFGCSLAIVAGVSGAGIVLVSVAFASEGVSAMQVNAIRFHGAWVLSGAILVFSGGPAISTGEWATSSAVGAFLGALPLIVLQFGVARSSPMTTELIMSALPGLVFLTDAAIAKSFDPVVAVLLCALIGLSAVAAWLELRAETRRKESMNEPTRKDIVLDASARPHP